MRPLPIVLLITPANLDAPAPCNDNKGVVRQSTLELGRRRREPCLARFLRRQDHLHCFRIDGFQDLRRAVTILDIGT